MAQLTRSTQDLSPKTSLDSPSLTPSSEIVVCYSTSSLQACFQKTDAFVSLHSSLSLNKKLSCRRDAARCFMSVNIILSHSRLLKVIRNNTLELGRACVSPYQYSIETMYLSFTVSDILNVEQWRDLEFYVKVSRSFKMVQFETLGTIFQSHSIGTMAVSLAVSTQYTDVTDRQRPHDGRPRLCIALRGKN